MIHFIPLFLTFLLTLVGDYLFDFILRYGKNSQELQ